MKKKNVLSMVLIMLAISLPVCFAATALFPGLASTVSDAIYGVGVRYIAIGAAVYAAGYAVYHYSTYGWKYYYARGYDQIDSHAYNLHGTEFGNIWSTTPSRYTFEAKCKSNMNDKSNQKYWQFENNRLVSYNVNTEMVTIGDQNGRFIVTCFRGKLLPYIMNQITTGRWISVKKY